MFIYVSGPYSASESLSRDERAEQITANIDRANEAGIALAAKGHCPFVPHTMMSGWEDQHGVPREVALGVCVKWVGRCDALLLLGRSAGADAEHNAAVHLGLPVFHTVEEVQAAAARPEPQSRPKRSRLCSSHEPDAEPDLQT